MKVLTIATLLSAKIMVQGVMIEGMLNIEESKSLDTVNAYNHAAGVVGEVGDEKVARVKI